MSNADNKLGIFDRLNNFIKNSISLKLFFIFILILLLLIPSAMIMDVVRERERTRDGAEREVSNKWGDRQTIGGPILSVPYTYNWINNDNEVEVLTTQLYFLPETLNIDGVIDPEIRQRGIFEVMLYNSKLNITGAFENLNFENLKYEPNEILWEKAEVSFSIPDLRGINKRVFIKWNEENLPFEPGLTNTNNFTSGVSALVNISEKIDKYTFNIEIDINGSKQLSFLPLGKETNVHLESTWAHPSFNGSFLPDNRKVNENGFTADWKVLYHNRNYPQKFIAAQKNNLLNSAFGVSLFVPIDSYTKTTRSVKYNIMFIGFTFLVFFFVELLHKIKVHPIQYLLIGFALTIFYLLLLSFSEHISFNLSYLIASIATIGLIALYSLSILKTKKLSSIVGATLAVLYAFLFVLLHQQDYALILGAIGLFVTLAIIMYLTRNVNWFGEISEE